MKKYLLWILILFVISGCSFNNNIENTTEIITDDIDILPPKEVYIDDNPLLVGLYQNGKLVHNINVSLKPWTDISSFDIYFTNEENTYDTNTKRNFNKYASNYEDVSKYKIGFMISFTTDEKEFKEIITSPKDMYILSPYIYNYLYDDINQKEGSFYSHVEDKDVTDNTIYSSIKLFAASDIDKINSSINLTVFTYDTEDDFDDDGMYRGNSKYTITIEK